VIEVQDDFVNAAVAQIHKVGRAQAISHLVYLGWMFDENPQNLPFRG